MSSAATSSSAAKPDAITDSTTLLFPLFAQIDKSPPRLRPCKSRLPGGTLPGDESPPQRRRTPPLSPTTATPTRSASEGRQSNLVRSRCARLLMFVAALLAGCSPPYVNSHIESGNA